MTEKNYNPEQKNVKVMRKQGKFEKQPLSETPKEIKDDKKMEQKDETEEKQSEKTDDKKETKKTEKPKVKKTEAIVRGENLPLSTKYSAAVCRFIKGKKIETAINDLEKVTALKKAVRVKGEMPHRKGKGMAGGRYPVKTAENFIMLLKSLAANSNANGLENPIITDAVANIGARPYGRFGDIRRKRTHIMIKAMEKK